MMRRSWLITAPSLGMILLFIAWSGYWYVLKEEAVEGIEKHLNYLKSSGITLTCHNRSYGGYPFRISFDCKQPVLEVKTRNVEATVKATHLTVTAQAYKLGHLIADTKGPFTFSITQHSNTPTIPATHTAGNLNSTSMRASLILSSIRKVSEGFTNISSFSVVGHNMHTSLLRTTSWGQKIPLDISATKAGVHIRGPRKPGTKGTDTDLALEALDLKLKGDFYTPLEGSQFTAKRIVFNGLIRPFYIDLRGGTSLAKSWHDAKGVAEVDALYIEREDISLRSEGILSLDKSGQLSGSLDTKILGFDNILTRLIEQKIMSKNQAVVANTGLQLLSSSSEEEQKQNILSIPVNFTNGQVYFGPHSLGFSPSFF